jgi:O-antigen/teichoic acid export membrane protein
MGIIIRQSFWNSLSGYLGVILGAGLTLWLYPNILSVEQYGLTRLLISIATVGSTFASLGLKNTLVRYFPYFRNPERSHHGLFFWALLIPGLGFLVLLLLYGLNTEWLITNFSDKSDLFRDFHPFLIPILLSLLYFEIVAAYARALQDTVVSSLIKDVGLRFGLIILLLVHYMGWITFDGFMIGFAGIYLLQSLSLLGYVLIRYPQRLLPDFDFLSKPMIKDMATYGSYALLGGLTTIIVGNIDILMIGALTDLTSTGIYSIAFYIGSVIQIPQRSIHKIAYPVISQAFKDERMDDIADIYRRTSINQLILGTLLLAGIYANLHNLHAILPAEFQSGDWVILVIGLAKLFDMATGINGGIILTSKYYRMDLWTNLLLVALAITTNLLLIPMYGLLGAAIATAISVFVYNSFKMIYVKWKLDMQPFDWRTIAVLIIGALTAWFPMYLPILDAWWLDIALRASLMTLVFGGLTLLLRLSPDINSIAQNTWQKLSSKS